MRAEVLLRWRRSRWRGLLILGFEGVLVELKAVSGCREWS